VFNRWPLAAGASCERLPHLRISVNGRQAGRDRLVGGNGVNWIYRSALVDISGHWRRASVQLRWVAFLGDAGHGYEQL